MVKGREIWIGTYNNNKRTASIVNIKKSINKFLLRIDTTYRFKGSGVRDTIVGKPFRTYIYYVLKPLPYKDNALLNKYYLICIIILLAIFIACQ